MPIDVCLVIDELQLPSHRPLEFTDYNPCDVPRTMGSTISLISICVLLAS